MQQGKRVKHHGESGKYDKIPQNERTGVNGLKYQQNWGKSLASSGLHEFILF